MCYSMYPTALFHSETWFGGGHKEGKLILFGLEVSIRLIGMSVIISLQVEAWPFGMGEKVPPWSVAT